MGLFGFLLIGLGGALGSILRGLISIVFCSLSPWPTLFVNVSGAFLIGLFVKLMENSSDPDLFKAFWIIGVCGGFTTFSTFGMEMIDMLKSSQWSMSFIYIFLNVFGSVLAIITAFRLFSYFQS
jgi:fluoride exporter